MIIKNTVVVNDEWSVLRLRESDAPESVKVPDGKVIVPLKVWQRQRHALSQRSDIGVWFASNERAADLQCDVSKFPVLAVDFPKFTDGRGYSIAYHLRNRFGFRGELRAIGDVLRDQLFYMKRMGFDAFALRPDANINNAIKSLGDFTLSYQASVNESQPLFRRVQRGAI